MHLIVTGIPDPCSIKVEIVVRARPALIDGSYKVTSITCSDGVSH